MKMYICNGEVPGCDKVFCAWKQNGECFHTSKEKYALNPEEERHFDSMENWELWEEMTRAEFYDRVGVHSYESYFSGKEKITADDVAFVAGMRRLVEDIKTGNYTES